MNNFAHIDEKHAEWQSLQPLKPEDEKRLWKKLRLEWNYHSNRIEGNTLTYGETELLFFHDRAVGDHEIRNYVEMKAHDVAIGHLIALVDDGRALSSGDIRDLNRLLLKEPFVRPAVTPDGKPTTIEIIPGEFKKVPNNVITASGAPFDFTPPSEVPAAIQQLLDWLQSEQDLHIVEVAAKLHHDFVCIHPFGDGNGRTARLLTNLILMKSDFPPVVILSDDKETYLAALSKADKGDMQPFTTFLATRVDVALSLGIRAASGHDIEDTNDIDKEIELFRRNLSPSAQRARSKNSDSVRRSIDLTITPLFIEFLQRFEKLDALYESSEIDLGFQWNDQEHYEETPFDEQDRKEYILGHMKALPSVRLPTLESLTMRYGHRNCKGLTKEPLDQESWIKIAFDDYSIALFTAPELEEINCGYDQQLSKTKREEIVTRLLKQAFEYVKSRSV